MSGENGPTRNIRDMHFTLALSGEDDDGTLLETVQRALEEMFQVNHVPGQLEPERGYGPGGAVLLTLSSQSVLRGMGELSDLDQHVLKWRTEYPLLGANIGEPPTPDMATAQQQLTAPLPEGATPTN